MQQQINSIDELIALVKENQQSADRLVIGISGFGGSGKSTLCNKLSSRFPTATVIHVDDFIETNEDGALPGYPHDWNKFEELTLKRLKSGNSVTSKIYDWQTNKLINTKTTVSQLILIDGPATLLQEKYRPYIDLSIWLDVPHEVATARGKKRDKEEQGVDHDELWDTVWAPLEAQGFQDNRPDKQADILFPNP